MLRLQQSQSYFLAHPPTLPVPSIRVSHFLIAPHQEHYLYECVAGIEQKMRGIRGADGLSTILPIERDFSV